MFLMLNYKSHFSEHRSQNESLFYLNEENDIKIQKLEKLRNKIFKNSSSSLVTREGLNRLYIAQILAKMLQKI